MKCKSLLAIGLMAATALLTAPQSDANPALMAQVAGQKSHSRQPDVKAMVERADKLYSEGKYRDAAAIWQQILAIQEKTLGPDHPEVATSLNYLALLQSFQGQNAAAKPLYRRSLAIREKALGPAHPDVATERPRAVRRS